MAKRKAQHQSHPTTPSINFRNLKPIPYDHLITLSGPIFQKSAPPIACYSTRCNRILVMEFNDTFLCNGTPWEGTRRVGIKTTTARTRKAMVARGNNIVLSWDDLQAIKDALWPKQIALEIYPPSDQIINAGDLRWLWVLPPKCQLPLNLSGKGIMLK